MTANTLDDSTLSFTSIPATPFADMIYLRMWLTSKSVECLTKVYMLCDCLRCALLIDADYKWLCYEVFL